MSLCFDCVEVRDQADVVLTAEADSSNSPFLADRDERSPESEWSTADVVAQWERDQYEQDVRHWEARVRSVRWQSFFLFLPCFGLFLAFRSWPLIALVIAVNFLGWRRIRHVESLRPAKSPSV